MTATNRTNAHPVFKRGDLLEFAIRILTVVVTTAIFLWAVSHIVSGPAQKIVIWFELAAGLAAIGFVTWWYLQRRIIVSLAMTIAVLVLFVSAAVWLIMQ